jgi:hypothetical protein
MPYETTIIGSGEPIRKDNLMDFRLIYRGELPSASNNNPHVREKHLIRKYFNHQLRRLWLVKSNLVQYARFVGNQALADSGNSTDDVDVRWNSGIEAMAKNWNKAGFDFLPLVTEKFTLRCSVDVLLLRPGNREFVFKQGDIDGRLKTLFDALRIPKDASETGNSTPDQDEHPFCVLLEDDKLISEVHIVVDELLLLPGEREVKANDAFAVIHVKINHIGGSPFDRWFD